MVTPLKDAVVADAQDNIVTGNYAKKTSMPRQNARPKVMQRNLLSFACSKMLKYF